MAAFGGSTNWISFELLNIFKELFAESIFNLFSISDDNSYENDYYLNCSFLISKCAVQKNII